MNLLGWDRTPIARRADNFADRATPSGEIVRSMECLPKGVLLSDYATPVYEPQPALVQYRPKLVVRPLMGRLIHRRITQRAVPAVNMSANEQFGQ